MHKVTVYIYIYIYAHVIIDLYINKLYLFSILLFVGAAFQVISEDR